MARTVDEITKDLVQATRELDDIRASREEAVALLADNARLQEARNKVTVLRDEYLAVVEQRAHQPA